MTYSGVQYGIKTREMTVPVAWHHCRNIEALPQCLRDGISSQHRQRYVLYFCFVGCKSHLINTRLITLFKHSPTHAREKRNGKDRGIIFGQTFFAGPTFCRMSTGTAEQAVIYFNLVLAYSSFAHYCYHVPVPKTAAAKLQILERSYKSGVIGTGSSVGQRKTAH